MEILCFICLDGDNGIAILLSILLDNIYMSLGPIVLTLPKGKLKVTYTLLSKNKRRLLVKCSLVKYSNRIRLNQDLDTSISQVRVFALKLWEINHYSQSRKMSDQFEQFNKVLRPGFGKKKFFRFNLFLSFLRFDGHFFGTFKDRVLYFLYFVVFMQLKN